MGHLKHKGKHSKKEKKSASTDVTSPVISPEEVVSMTPTVTPEEVKASDERRLIKEIRKFDFVDHCKDILEESHVYHEPKERVIRILLYVWLISSSMHVVDTPERNELLSDVLVYMAIYLFEPFKINRLLPLLFDDKALADIQSKGYKLNEIRENERLVDKHPAVIINYPYIKKEME